MAFNSVRLACLVSDDLSTYEVEEVAEGTSMAVVGEMRGNIIQSLSGGANPHWHLVFFWSSPGALVWLSGHASGRC